ncbi:MAG TPA: ABC transporter substrate-binding protein [Kofleriaceae bacterium]|nr:ABC transporter substrate-binding protein [Kofleriaceae bacterium]
MVLALTCVVCACESPARVKPWRHAPDPTSEAANAPGSPVLTEGGPTEQQLIAARPHTLRIHMDADPGRLTPIVDPSLWAKRITVGTIFEPLLRYEPADANGPARFTSRLARSWRVMPGGQEIRIELQPGVTFSDGRPLTSSDVQFTLDTVRDSRHGVRHLRPMLDDIFRVELISPLEVRLVLNRPNGWVLRALAEIPILPMHIYDGSLLGGGALIGTGPWKLASHKNGIAHLVANDKYWGGKPAISDIEFVYEPDAAIALTDAKRGEMDIVPALIPAHWPEQATAPGLAASFMPLQLAPAHMRMFRFNASRPALADARVRHALALLIDRRAIAKRVFDGLARPMSWPIWPGGPVDGAEEPVPDFDPAAAAKLLDAAGWTDSDKDGIRDHGSIGVGSNGQPEQLHLVLIGHDKPAPKDASGPPVKTERDYFVEAARRAGIVIEVKTGGDQWLDKHVDGGDWDLLEVSWSGRVDMDITPLIAGAKDPTRPLQPHVDRVLDAMSAAWDPAERGKLAKELATALGESWPIAGIVAEAPQGLIHRRVENVKVWDGWIDLSQLRFAKPSP